MAGLETNGISSILTQSKTLLGEYYLSEQMRRLGRQPALDGIFPGKLSAQER
jgi:hypothetical protein